MGSLMHYALEAKMWKAGPALEFTDREYVASLAKIFARGMKR